MSITNENSRSTKTIEEQNAWTATMPEHSLAMCMKHHLSYRAKQINVSEFARLSNLSRPTVYKYLRLLE